MRQRPDEEILADIDSLLRHTAGQVMRLVYEYDGEDPEKLMIGRVALIWDAIDAETGRYRSPGHSVTRDVRTPWEFRGLLYEAVRQSELAEDE